MKSFWRSQFIADYGSLLILIGLCVYYSFATLSIQYPVTPAAGEALADRMASELGQGTSVVIVVRPTEGDRQFSDALQQRLSKHGLQVIETITGDPRTLRESLVRIGAAGTPLQAIATHQPGSQWGPIREEGLQSLGKEYPSLANIKVYQPRSYLWPSFLTRENLVNVINQNADVAIIAIAMTLVIITAGIDLSVGSLLALCGVTTAILIHRWSGNGHPGSLTLVFCALAGIGICAARGIINGVMVTWFRIPAFVATLGMMMIARGLALIAAVQHQKALSGGTTEGTPEAIRIGVPAFGWLGNGVTLGLPNPIWLMLILYVLTHVLMSRTFLGRYIYAVGGNPEAARLSGVPVKAVLIFVYAVCGALAGLGGVVDASRFDGGRPNAGEFYELQVIAAVVVGGTSLAGGEGRIFGTLIGALIIAVIQNGLNMAGVKSYEQKVVFGLLILGAVLLDRLKTSVWRSQAARN